MSWYEKISKQCRGNGQWCDCINAVHARRDEVYKEAVAKAEEMGHRLSPFNPMHMAQCLRCGMWIKCQNIMAPTAASNLSGGVVIEKCSKPLIGERFGDPEDYIHTRTLGVV